MSCFCSLPVLPVLGLCAHVHRQGSHPHRSMWQHVYVCQEKMLPGAAGVWIHMARSKSPNLVHQSQSPLFLQLVNLHINPDDSWINSLAKMSEAQIMGWSSVCFWHCQHFLHHKGTCVYWVINVCCRNSTVASFHLKMTTTTCAWRVPGTRNSPTHPFGILSTRRSAMCWVLIQTSSPGWNRAKAARCSVATTAGCTAGRPRSSRMRGWLCGPCSASSPPPWRFWPSSWIRSASPTQRDQSSFCQCAVTCTVLPTWWVWVCG